MKAIEYIKNHIIFIGTTKKKHEYNRTFLLLNLICYFKLRVHIMVSVTEDGSVNDVPQILYGPNLILGAFGSYMF